jgi:O-antigen ligase
VLEPRHHSQKQAQADIMATAPSYRQGADKAAHSVDLGNQSKIGADGQRTTIPARPKEWVVIWQAFVLKWLWPSVVVALLLWGWLNEGAEKQIDTAMFSAMAAGILGLSMLDKETRTQFERLRGWTLAAWGLGLVILVMALQFTPFPFSHGGSQVWARPDMATVDTDNTIRGMIRLSSAVAFFIFGAVFAVDRNRRYVVLFLLGVALTVVLIQATIAYNTALFAPNDLVKAGKKLTGVRMAGTFLSANAFASLLLLCLGLVMAVFGAETPRLGGKNRHWVRVCACALGIATFICIYQTLSRTALVLALLVAFVFSLLLMPRARLAILGMGAVGGIALLIVGTFAKQLGIPMRDFDFAGSYVGRTAEWDMAWRLFEMRPILGWGAGTYAWISEPLKPPPLADVGLTVGTPYNFVLLIASETGLLGLAAWSVLGIGLAKFAGLGMRAGRWRGVLAVGFALACGSIIVHNITDFSLSVTAIAATWSFALGYAGGLGTHRAKPKLRSRRRPSTLKSTQLNYDQKL